MKWALSEKTRLWMDRLACYAACVLTVIMMFVITMCWNWSGRIDLGITLGLICGALGSLYSLQMIWFLSSASVRRRARTFQQMKAVSISREDVIAQHVQLSNALWSWGQLSAMIAIGYMHGFVAGWPTMLLMTCVAILSRRILWPAAFTFLVIIVRGITG